MSESARVSEDFDSQAVEVQSMNNSEYYAAVHERMEEQRKQELLITARYMEENAEVVDSNNQAGTSVASSTSGGIETMRSSEYEAKKERMEVQPKQVLFQNKDANNTVRDFAENLENMEEIRKKVVASLLDETDSKVYRDMGASAYAMGNFQDANAYFGMSLVIDMANCEILSKDSAETHKMIGTLYMQTEKSEKGKRHLAMALEIHQSLAQKPKEEGHENQKESVQDQVSVADIRNAKGRLLYENEEYPLAREELDRARGELDGARELLKSLNKLDGARELLKSLNNNFRMVEAVNHKNMGLVCRKSRDLAAAKKEFQTSLDIFQTVDLPSKKRVEVGETYNSLANVYKEEGDARNAILNYIEAIKIYADTADQNIALATTYNNLGYLSAMFGKPHTSEIFYERSLAIKKAALEEENARANGKESSSAKMQVAKIYYYIGSVKQKKSEFKEAIAELEKALSMMREALGEDHSKMANIYDSIGNCYMEMEEKELEKAEECFQKSLQIKQRALRIDDPSVQNDVFVMPGATKTDRSGASSGGAFPSIDAMLFKEGEEDIFEKEDWKEKLKDALKRDGQYHLESASSNKEAIRGRHNEYQYLNFQRALKPDLEDYTLMGNHP
ncbi:unnamed protein product, partial [Cylindrotheca closterium]